MTIPVHIVIKQKKEKLENPDDLSRHFERSPPFLLAESIWREESQRIAWKPKFLMLQTTHLCTPYCLLHRHLHLCFLLPPSERLVYDTVSLCTICPY